MFACGNCVYYAMWLSFPPTASWVVIFPIWLIVLSAVQSVTGAPLRWVPPVIVTLVLVGCVVWFSPGMIGPPLGFWIPVCCIAGTWSGLFGPQLPRTRDTVIVTTVCALLALTSGATYDYIQYYRMTQEQRDRFKPVWERPRRQVRADLTERSYSLQPQVSRLFNALPFSRPRHAPPGDHVGGGAGRRQPGGGAGRV